MSLSGDPNDVWAEHAFTDLQATMLNPLLEYIVGDEADQDSSLYQYRTTLFGEIIGNWVPMGVASGYLPVSETQQWLSFAEESIDRTAMRRVAENLRPMWANTWEESESTEFDRLQAGDALAVATTTTEDEAETELMARVLFDSSEDWNVAMDGLRDLVSRARSQAELLGLAAELPAWLTEGPYRLQAEISFLGEELAGDAYHALRELLALATSGRAEAQNSVETLMRRAPTPLPRFVEFELILSGHAPDWAWGSPERKRSESMLGRPALRVPPHKAPMFRVARGMEWRLSPGDSQSIGRLVSLRRLQIPLIRAVITEGTGTSWGNPHRSTTDAWTYEELQAALGEYEEDLRYSGIEDSTIRTYINTARRFLRRLL